jgi:hypothetical protein
LLSEGDGRNSDSGEHGEGKDIDIMSWARERGQGGGFFQCLVVDDSIHFIPTHNARVMAPEVDLILVFVFLKEKLI